MKSALGGTRKQVFDKAGEHYELREVSMHICDLAACQGLLT